MFDTKIIKYIKEPDSLQCGQAVLAMLTGKSVEEIIDVVGTERETKLKDMFDCLDKFAIEYDSKRKQAFCKNDLPRETTLKEMFYTLDFYGIAYDKTRKEVKNKSELPKIAILSLETPRCWHWSLYAEGVFYDPEHGVLEDFPKANRKYYFEIK